MPEREPDAQEVLLAWRRTALEIGIVSIVGARYLADELSPWIAGLGLVGVVLALALHGAAGRVYRGGVEIDRRITVRHGALTAFVASLGVAALALVMTL